MSGFFSGLWNSIFQPGTSPQLIIATHVSFIALLLTLSWLIYVTRGNIHFIALFVIALLLWISIIWFIQELKNVRLMTNEELKKQSSQNNNTSNNTEKKKKDTDSKLESMSDKHSSNDMYNTGNGSVTYSSAVPNKNLKSRKV